MGAGGFAKERKEIDNLFPLILLSLTKIKLLKDYLTSNVINGKLSKELTNIIENNNEIRRNQDINNMKSEILRIIENKSRNKERIKLPEITINYIIKKLKEEFQGNENSEKLIQNLFYQKKSQEPLILSLDIFNELNIDEPINDELKKFEDDIPEIIIININNFNKSYIEFYQALAANNIPYDLIYFIQDIDEYNESFFKENGQFAKYNLKDNKSIITEKEKEKIGSPKIIFYQKKNELINSMNDNKKLLRKEFDEILESMNEHIIPEHTYEDYYLMNKNIYDEIIKILNNPGKSPLKKYSEIREISKNVNLLKITLNEINKIKFPQYFVIIKKNTLEKFLKDCWLDLTDDDEKTKYKFKDDLPKNIYKIKFGENHAFIKVQENKENILVCHYNEKEKIFEVESVLNYSKKDSFYSEVKDYISNRGGMEYFYAKKNLDIKKLDQQGIIENGEKIGVLANLMNLENHMILRKYNRIRNIKDNNINHTIIKDIKKEEVYTGHESMPVSVINKAVKSICKIIVNKEVNNKIQESYGTGFFMNVSKTLKCLITNYHVIDPEKETIFKIEIYNHKKMKLKTNGRLFSYLQKPIDITAIEIKDTDELFNDIEFLEYDVSYENAGYEIYKNNDVFSIQHPLGNNAACASGTIINIIQNYEFSHNISTKGGSSGSPIILLNNNINFVRVVGIHKSGIESQKINYGTFIGEIIKKINNNSYYAGNPGQDSYINNQSQSNNEENLSVENSTFVNPIFKLMGDPMENNNQNRRMSNTLEKININSNN